jgi:hypothetical protein
MILQAQRQFVWPCLVRRTRLMRRRPGQFHIVLNQHAVVKRRYSRRLQQFSCRIKSRPVKHNRVRLPLSRRTRRIHQRRILPIHRCRRSIRIRLALIRIQYLHLIQIHQEHPAVSAVLILAFRRRWFHEFQVQLAIAKSLLRLNVPGLLHDFKVSISNFPFCRSFILGLPLRQILPIKQYNRIGRWSARRVLRARCARIHHCRQRPLSIMNFLFDLWCLPNRCYPNHCRNHQPAPNFHIVPLKSQRILHPSPSPAANIWSAGAQLPLLRFQHAASVRAAARLRTPKQKGPQQVSGPFRSIINRFLVFRRPANPHPVKRPVHERE